MLDLLKMIESIINKHELADGKKMERKDTKRRILNEFVKKA